MMSGFNQTQHVLIATGGTGGHVYPALAVAEELISRGVKVSWMGTRKGMEAKIISEKSIPIYFVSVSGLRGKGLIGWLLAPLKLIVAISQAISILIKQQPNLVLGMGGFVSGPGGLASWLLRKPLVIHEQNTIAGMTNKILSSLATTVFEAFPNTFSEKVNAIKIGNPIRKEFIDIEPPQKRFSSRINQDINILVLGGSLGATALNEYLPTVFKALSQTNQVKIMHQTGSKHIEQTKDLYSESSLDVDVVDYINNMAELYAWADLVICRSGALTVSELAAAGVGSVLIPYPYAVDDHQFFNAEYLVEGNAAIVVRQSKFQSKEFIKMLEELICQGREKLLTMAENARALAMPNATMLVADYCCNLMTKTEQI